MSGLSRWWLPDGNVAGLRAHTLAVTRRKATACKETASATAPLQPPRPLPPSFVHVAHIGIHAVRYIMA
eukprot:12408680-Karenia_brevis.AAC.1